MRAGTLKRCHRPAHLPQVPRHPLFLDAFAQPAQSIPAPVFGAF